MITSDYHDVPAEAVIIEDVPMMAKQWSFLARRKLSILDMYGHPSIAHACQLHKENIICKPADLESYLGYIQQYVDSLSAKALTSLLQKNVIEKKPSLPKRQVIYDIIKMIISLTKPEW